MPALRARIDAESCAASALCQRVAPEIFSMPDDADTATVLVDTVTDPAQMALVREAEAGCPTAAIVVEEL